MKLFQLHLGFFKELPERRTWKEREKERKKGAPDGWDDILPRRSAKWLQRSDPVRGEIGMGWNDKGSLGSSGGEKGTLW